VFLSRTVSLYISRQFLQWFAIVFLTLLGLVLLIDAVELLRRSAGKPDVTMTVVAQMSMLRLLFLAQQIVPFAVMFAGIFAFLRLTRSNELIIVRAAGVSVWQFLLPVICIALAIGCLKTMVINPVSSVMLEQFEKLEGKYFTGRSSLLAVSTTGVWLRQAADETGRQAVIHAEKVDPEALLLGEVIVFIFQGEDTFISRIDARSARLRDGYWAFQDISITGPERVVQRLETFELATDLTPERIQESFASPDTVSFWQLPRFIEILEDTGFSALPHRLQFQALIAEPFLLTAMVLIAAVFSLRLTRRGGTILLVGAGAITGFLLLMLTDILHALSLGATIPVSLAAWTPAGVSLMAGGAILLHLEDG
jgi:lipopolysaccharide export system permease protein